MTADPPTPTATEDRHVVSARALLTRTVEEYAPTALASSMSAEDMVLIDLVAAARLPIDVFVLDTGRLHGETLALIQETRARYRLPIKVYAPDTRALETYVNAHGPDGIFESVGLRKRCCEIRKVEPLRRALSGHKAWITGQRRGQSVTRRTVAEEEWDEVHRLHKVNPLAAWSRDDVWAYIEARGVSYNPLYDQGYASIGCAPCTRAIEPGEDERAGRWWWEGPDSRECGIHANGNGRHPRAAGPGDSASAPTGEGAAP